MSALPGNPAVLKTKVDGLVASADTIQSAIDDLRKFVTSSKSKAVQATHEQVKNAEKSLAAAHGRYKNTGLALREYQAVLANCHKRAEAAAAREESANRQRSDAQGTVTATKRRLQQLQGSHAPSVNVMNAQNAYNEAVANERRATTAATAAATEIAQIAQEVDEAASRAIGKIDTAMSGTTDNLMDKISQFIEGIGKKLEEFGKWVATVLKKLVALVVEVITKVMTIVIVSLAIVALFLGILAIGFTVALLAGFAAALLAGVLTGLTPLLPYILIATAVVLCSTLLLAWRQRNQMDQYYRDLDTAERRHGPADVHYGDNGETTETVNTRPGREGLIRDKMDLAGRPNPRGDWREPPGWHEVGPEELRRIGIDPALLSNEQSGFHATLFRDDNGRYVLSYEGTDFNDLDGDVVADVMGAGATSAQVHQAILAATTVKQRLMSNGVTAGNFSLTGHSLGGELAAVGSIATASKATTFNAAGVSFSSLNEALNAAKQHRFFTSEVDARARVENYSYSKDPLTNIQKYSPVPEAYGRQITINAPARDKSGPLDLDWGHGLDALKQQYDREHRHLYESNEAKIPIA